MRALFLLIVFGFASCAYQLKVKTGDQAFQLKQYALAADLFKQEYERSDNVREKAVKAFKLGQSYHYNSDYGQALKWFKKAYDAEYGAKALEEYAYALKNNGEYEAAVAAFQQLAREVNNPYEYRRQITICNLILEWKNERRPYSIRLYPYPGINEISADYGGVLDVHGGIWFVSDRLNENIKPGDKFSWTGRFYSDLYKYEKGEMIRLPEVLNGGGNEGSFCFGRSSEELYFTRCGSEEYDADYCNIFFSKYQNGSWQEPEGLVLISEPGNALHPAWHSGDSILIFSSDAKGGLGGYDLYYSKRSETGWQAPVNLGKSVNSEKDEKFPVWYRDTLFFSSNGWPGMGGLDVFKTYRDDMGMWMPPLNLKTKLNSEADDFSLYIDPDFVPNDSILMVGLLSSNRDHSEHDDVYKVEWRKQVTDADKNRTEKFKWEIQANIRFISHESYRSGIRPAVDSVQLVEKESKSGLGTGARNSLSLKLLPGELYTFLASRRNYLNQEFSFETPVEPVLERDSLHRMDIEVELLPFVVNEEFIIQELYYDFDRWEIRPDAERSLDGLKQILITNPRLRILLGSHTDCRGEDRYNQELSEKRAKSAVEWLISKGISPDRLLYKGYGESSLAIGCECERCSEEEHQKNRRTTIKILP